MPQFLAYSIAGVLLFCIALYGLIVQPRLLRKIMALNVMGWGVFLFLVSSAKRNAVEHPDPVPHAMVLTGIVVALAATAFAISLTLRIHAATGKDNLEDAE